MNGRTGAAAALAAAAGVGCAGWAVGSLLGAVSPVPPWACAAFGALLALGWSVVAGWAAAGAAAWAFSLGALALIPALGADRMAPVMAGLEFERIGLLRVGDAWVRVGAVTYLPLLAVGGVMAAAWTAAGWAVRRDPRAIRFVGCSSLLAAGCWRILMHPPSGDEPSLLLASWHWLETGSLDLVGALARPEADWSRAAEFGDDVHAFHTAGLPGGPRLTVHGFGLPVLLGTLLAPLGRVGLAAALAAAALATTRVSARLVASVTGREPSARWTAAMLMGSPLAVYTVFVSPDLPGALLFGIGALGLVTRRPAPLLVAIVVLPWLHHKLLLTGSGLALGAWLVSPRLGALATAAWLVGGAVEAAAVAHAFGVSPWPPGGLWTALHDHFAGHPHVGTYSPANWVSSSPGLLVGRYAGLIHYPAFVIGLSWLARAFRVRREVTALVAACVPYLLVLLSYDTWMGGDGAPGRMLVMMFPVLALGLGAMEGTLKSGPWSAGVGVAVWAGVAMTQAAVFMPALAFVSAKARLEAAVVRFAGFDPLAILPALSLDEAGSFPGWWAVLLTAAVVAVLRGIPVRLKRAGGRPIIGRT